MCAEVAGTSTKVVTRISGRVCSSPARSRYVRCMRRATSPSRTAARLPRSATHTGCDPYPSFTSSQTTQGTTAAPIKMMGQVEMTIS
eukprot:7313391-Prymnesium_polylepis.1